MGKYTERINDRNIENNYIPKNNLPAELTEFIGRKIEIEKINKLLKTARLITLWGPGGIGKSRLSLKVASINIKSYKDGVYYIPLDSITQPDLVVSCIAKTLNIVEIPGQDILDSLKSALRDKKRLLILDNFEQVMEAALIVSELLLSAAELSVIVTSREPLRISGEHIYNVPPLDIPDSSKRTPIEELKEQPSIALFLSRVKAVELDFDLTEKNAQEIEELCADLEGIPLAIELAAAYIGQIPVREMIKLSRKKLEWLNGGPRDLPKRQQTLRNTIEWGYNLLDENQQKLFKRLGVFTGRFDFKAVNAVVNFDRALGDNVYDDLISLVNKSIVKAAPDMGIGEKYYDMLETIREYAVELFEKSEEKKLLEDFHSRYYLNYVVEAESNINGPSRQIWLSRLEYAHSNLLSALEYFQLTLSSENELRMAGILGHFWEVRGYWNEGIHRLDSIINKYKNVTASKNLVKVYKCYGRLLDLQGKHTYGMDILQEGLKIAIEIKDREGEAGIIYNLALAEGVKEEILFKQSLAIYREIGDMSGIAAVLQELSQVSFYYGDFKTAELYSAESLEISNRLADKLGRARALGKMGLVARGKGDYEYAGKLFNECLSCCQELDDKEGIANALLNLADLSRSRGMYELSKDYYLRILNIGYELGYIYIITRALKDLGEIYRYRGNFKKANELYNESLSLLLENGDYHGELPWLYRNMAEVEMQLKNYSKAEELYIKSLQLRREYKLHTLMYVFLVFEGLAAIASELEQQERAARLFGAAERLLEITGSLISKCDRMEYESRLARFTYKTGNTNLDKFISEGKLMSLENSLDYAMEKKSKTESNMASKMISYIHENYNKDISLDNISEYFNLSQGYVSTMFKYYTGENFKDYLNYYRVKKAKEILESGNMKINEVSDMVGCNHINTFIRIFKKYEGISPSQYVQKQ